jgi:hypothetical protein
VLRYSEAKVWIASAQYFGVAKTHTQMVMAAISQTSLEATNQITLNKPQQSHNANRQRKSAHRNRSGLENTSAQIVRVQKRQYADAFVKYQHSTVYCSSIIN